MIPLILKLKKDIHKRIAIAQDLIIQELYNIFNDAVLHGGTAIWRCYNGNRFSEDIDVYLQKNIDKINLLFEKLNKQGFTLKKKKISKNSLYSVLEYNRAIIRLEALFKKVSGSLKEYETADSNLITVYTLTPEQFILEKIDTYLKRRKIRDLYDIFFLLRYADVNKIKNKLNQFIKHFNKPIDEKELRVLIIQGLVPTSEKMFDYIKQYGKRKIS